eukprot:SAG25_NODE_829_length_5170_cov_2.432656_4_plen_119_part_00
MWAVCRLSDTAGLVTDIEVLRAVEASIGARHAPGMRIVGGQLVRAEAAASSSQTVIEDRVRNSPAPSGHRSKSRVHPCAELPRALAGTAASESIGGLLDGGEHGSAAEPASAVQAHDA